MAVADTRPCFPLRQPGVRPIATNGRGAAALMRCTCRGECCTACPLGCLYVLRRDGTVPERRLNLKRTTGAMLFASTSDSRRFARKANAPCCACRRATRPSRRADAGPREAVQRSAPSRPTAAAHGTAWVRLRANPPVRRPPADGRPRQTASQGDAATTAREREEDTQRICEAA